MIFPSTPAELAVPFAEKRFISNDLDSHDKADADDLIRLDRMAEDMGMMDTWFVHAGRGMIIPATFDIEDSVAITTFNDGMTFEGTFTTYSRVSVGKIIGAGAIHALCMTFETALLVPDFVEMDRTDLLHVPVLAATDMSTAA